MNTIDPVAYRQGVYASVCELLSIILSSPWDIHQSTLQCLNAHPQDNLQLEVSSNSCVVLERISSSNQDLQTMIAPFIRKGPKDCYLCNTRLIRVYQFQMPPPLLVFDTVNCRCKINPTLLVTVGNNRFRYNLAGIIYFGSFHKHFTLSYVCLIRLLSDSRGLTRL